MSISKVPGIPLFYGWLPLHCYVVGFQPLAVSYLHSYTLILFLRVFTTDNTRAGVGYEVIHVYVQLRFDMIPTSTVIMYINMNIEVHTITSVQLFRRLLCCLACNTRDNYRKVVVQEIEYDPVVC